MEKPVTANSGNDIVVKIADFGLSRVNDTDMMTGVLGTFVSIANRF